MFIDPKIQTLWNLGHFFNPLVKDGKNVMADSLHLLTFNDDVVIQALMSLQDMGGVVLKKLGRNRGADGDLDEFTKVLFDTPRCGEPDYYLPGKVGSGSWPEPCQKRGVTYSFDPTGMPSKFAATFEKNILDFVVNCWRKVGCNLVKHTGSGQANIRIFFKNYGGSIIGMAEFNNESCGDSVFCTLSPSFNPNEPTEADLLLHETGHCMNLQHINSNDGTMNPYIITRNSFKEWTPSDPSWNTIVRYFGGEPITPPIPVPVEPKLVLVSSLPNVDLIEIDIKNLELRTKNKGVLTDTYILLSNRII